MFHPIDLHVGKRIRFKRKMIGLTQSDLGGKVDLTFQQIQKYEKGENRVSASKLYQIAQILDTNVSFFFDGYNDIVNEREEITDDKQSVDLVKSFKSIKNPKVKKRIMMLIDSVIDEEN
ncbi:MAG: helix-turn-helix transcriptional regulator [Alphaproteobacteria bacterium]|nr:helix-turn-helix transcriptional regulator [Alphaproteobacteria bacterium]MBT5827451.1 helix-turn-helix transcriptional regulator [Alphaproteobacteria bacterium]